MKIVNITGGLGNQMFQYAFALALKNKYPEEKVCVDIQHYKTFFFKRFKGINLHNGYEIAKVFPNANLPIAKPKELLINSYWIPNYVLSRLLRKILPIRSCEYIAPYKLNYCYDKNAFENPQNSYFEGYWQCIKYFIGLRNILYETYSPPTPNDYNKRLKADIQGCNSVGIHVRRGDYLNEPEFKDICDIKYYSKAINEILKQNKQFTFFIFSNDIKWCQDNLAPLMNNNRVVYVSGNKGVASCWDMFLMTYCKYLIIANSSFSWWSAFLNRVATKIYVPFPWLNRDCEIDLYDNSWIKIQCS